MEEMELAINAATTPAVQLWMNWMIFIFIISIVFVWKYKAARIVLAAFILTLPMAMLIFNLSKSVHLIGIAHLILWGPLAFYLIKYEIKIPSFNFKSVYGVWVMLLLGTIVISLVFDARDIILVMLGEK